MIEIIGPDNGVWDRVDMSILGAIRGACPTESGWRGVMPDGRVVDVRSSRPGVHADAPGGAGWLRVRSPEDGRLYPFLRFGRGLYLINSRRSPTSKRRQPDLEEQNWTP